MNSIFLTNVDHCRAKVHSFNYKTLSVLLDLDKLSEAKDIGYNHFKAFSIWDKDHLPGKTGQIKQKLISYLEDKNINTKWARIELLTSPKFLGYAFNPVSFYLLYKEDYSEDNSKESGKNDLSPDLLIAEVNNTFGETHLYFTTRVEDKKNPKYTKYIDKKDFHVSPFYDLKGNYEFFIARKNNNLEIKIHLEKEGKTVFTSSISGNTVAKQSSLNTLLWGVKYSWLTFPRISFNAAILYFQKRLKVFTKPLPESRWTIAKRKPNLLESISKKLVIKYFNRLKKGSLTLHLPNDDSMSFGKSDSEHKAILDIKDNSFFTRVLFGGDIAFGECYVDKVIDSPDLTKLLGIFALNVDYFDDRNIVFSKINQVVNTISHKLRANTLSGSEKNISAHYDLGNKLYKKFLDPNLIYSSAAFDSKHTDLESAQINKIKKILKRVEIDSHEKKSQNQRSKLLEIGSGWGALAILASESMDVETITLSSEQLSYVNNKIKELGLDSKIKASICDYRNVEGKFDSIVSIEMLEAVGHENLETFFKKCHSLLKPQGKLAIQVITFPDYRYKNYRTSCDWIQKYIFPGGLCPSLGAISMASSQYFNIENSENLAKSYAQTLKTWRENFNSSWNEISKDGYDERFKRMWNYYLCYCEAGFECDVLGTYQIEMRRI